MKETCCRSFLDPRCHREDARTCVPPRRVELVREVVAGTPRAGAEAVAPLYHESADDAVERDPVVVRRLLLFTRRGIAPFLCSLHQADEVGDGIRRFLFEQANRDDPSVVSN